MGFARVATIYEMPAYLKDTYNCYNAISLDAGRSSALVVNDTHWVGPGRKVVDGYVAIPKPAFIEQQIKDYKRSNNEQKVLNNIADLFLLEFYQKGDQHRLDTIKQLESIESSKRLWPLVKQRVFLRKLINEMKAMDVSDQSYGFKQS